MGGFGSGRWGWHEKKQTVEECRILNVDRLAREGRWSEGRHYSALLNWNNGKGEKSSSISYKVITTNPEDAWININYLHCRVGQSVNTRIELTRTFPKFGGVRWWFICPLNINGKACKRRVGRLYLPPGRIYFGCRHCYNLTYKSCQESHIDNDVNSILAKLLTTLEKT